MLDRIQQDLDAIANAIALNDRSDSEIYSNSPNKDSERENRSSKGNLTSRNNGNSTTTQQDSSYLRRLRTRRSRNSVVTKF